MASAKVENLRRPYKTVAIDRSERVCANCVWYEQYYRESRTNIQCRVFTSTGYCLLHEQQRGPLRQPCRDYEKPE